MDSRVNALNFSPAAIGLKTVNTSNPPRITSEAMKMMLNFDYCRPKCKDEKVECQYPYTVTNV